MSKRTVGMKNMLKKVAKIDDVAVLHSIAAKFETIADACRARACELSPLPQIKTVSYQVRVR